MQGECAGFDLFKWKNKLKILQWKYEYKVSYMLIIKRKMKWEIYEEKDLH